MNSLDNFGGCAPHDVRKLWPLKCTKQGCVLREKDRT